MIPLGDDSHVNGGIVDLTLFLRHGKRIALVRSTTLALRDRFARQDLAGVQLCHTPILIYVLSWLLLESRRPSNVMSKDAGVLAAPTQIGPQQCRFDRTTVSASKKGGGWPRHGDGVRDFRAVICLRACSGIHHGWNAPRSTRSERGLQPTMHHIKFRQETQPSARWKAVALLRMTRVGLRGGWRC